MLKINVNQLIENHSPPLLKYQLHNTKVMNLINNYAFDKKKGVTNNKEMALKHDDSYMQANQRDAMKFLTNLVTPMLKPKLL